MKTWILHKEPPMKTWILRPHTPLSDLDNPWSPWYDKAFGFVVAAETAREARQLANDRAGTENWDDNLEPTRDVWLQEKYTTCQEMAPTEPGIILRDFASA